MFCYSGNSDTYPPKMSRRRREKPADVAISMVKQKLDRDGFYVKEIPPKGTTFTMIPLLQICSHFPYFILFGSQFVLYLCTPLLINVYCEQRKMFLRVTDMKGIRTREKKMFENNAVSISLIYVEKAELHKMSPANYCGWYEYKTLHSSSLVLI